jgi:hypothetical protein
MSADNGCGPIPEPYVMQGILHRELIKAINERDEARKCLREAVESLEENFPPWEDCNAEYDIERKMAQRWRKAAGMKDVP